MRGVRRRVLHCFLDDGLVSGAAGGNKRQRPGCGDREKTIGSHQVLQFGAAGDVCGMALLRICTIARSEEHTSALQSLMRNPYAVVCLTKKTNKHTRHAKHT